MGSPLVTTEAASVPGVSASVHKANAGETPLSDAAHKNLKRRTAHGALVSISAQAANFVLRTGSLMVLARLLLKEDFGLVNMVTALTGFLGLFRDAGLSMATVQRATISKEQTSTLFWVNVVVGGLLAMLTAAGAPLLAAFYREPRLFWVTAALGVSFLFNGASAQHRAILQRNLRFTALAATDVTALVLSVAIGIGMALTGWGYWSLVAMNLVQPAVGAAGVWLATRWVPGWPKRGTGIRSMLWFGSTVTLNSVIIYLAFNMDKVLLGRFWGAETLGVYGRAYQLINIPTDNLNSTMGMVALPGLSRVQNDPERQRLYFLKGYALYLSLVMPITVACALFAHDMIRVLLGQKWSDAAGIFQLLAPTILTFALLNPFGWLMLSQGQAARSLKVSLLVAPITILSFAIGLKYGPQGVAAGFSIAMLLLIVPVVSWAKNGTLIIWNDILKAVGIPFLSVAAGAGIVWLFAGQLARLETPILRLTAESAILFGIYFVMLMVVFKQWKHYSGMLKETGLWRRDNH